MAQKKFEEFTMSLIGEKLNHVWNGHGSSVFLEFGKLADPEYRKDGSLLNPRGEVGLMIEWSWRIEGKKRIVCGSWSDETDWDRGYSMIKGQKISKILMFGNLPEIQVTFENGASCISFMTERDHPSWAFFDRRADPSNTYLSRNGQIEME